MLANKTMKKKQNVRETFAPNMVSADTFWYLKQELHFFSEEKSFSKNIFFCFIISCMNV